MPSRGQRGLLKIWPKNKKKTIKIFQLLSLKKFRFFPKILSPSTFKSFFLINPNFFKLKVAETRKLLCSLPIRLSKSSHPCKGTFKAKRAIPFPAFSFQNKLFDDETTLVLQLSILYLLYVFCCYLINLIKRPVKTKLPVCLCYVRVYTDKIDCKIMLFDTNVYSMFTWCTMVK